MKYPCLVKKSLCKTDVTCEFEREGLNQYGEPLETIKFMGKCNYQDKARTVLTTEKKTVQVTGTALFPGDICRNFQLSLVELRQSSEQKKNRTGRKSSQPGWKR